MSTDFTNQTGSLSVTVIFPPLCTFPHSASKPCPEPQTQLSLVLGKPEEVDPDSFFSGTSYPMGFGFFFFLFCFGTAFQLEAFWHTTKLNSHP